MELRNPKVFLSIVAVGIFGGISGLVLTIILHGVQHIAFNYSYADHFTFLEALYQTTPLHRVLVLAACGLVGGLGWVCIHRYGSPLRSIKEVVSSSDVVKMPVKTTICHGLLQIITVGMGSPLGREVAPREVSVALTTWWLDISKLGLDGKTCKILLACASGAGLAAVYNAPLSATVFILETLLLEWSVASLCAALITCFIATTIVRLGIGDIVQYPLSSVAFSDWIIVWALIAGPILALGVHALRKSTTLIPNFAKNKFSMVGVSVLAFTAIGLMSIYYPEILGNGKAGNELTFIDDITWKGSLALFAAKWISILLADTAGAYGGRITPSMMLGSTSSLVLAVVWNVALPGSMNISVPVAAITGGTVFLGLAQKMPYTSIIFLLELTRLSPSYAFPMCATMGIALLTLKCIERK